MKTDQTISVAIHCLVYNHEPYLRDCFEGFVMQKTNFRFVAVVHDDCSTDGSAEIIREYTKKYPEIFKPIFENQNQYKKGGFGLINSIMQNAIDATEAKYIAFCEGDDYWTDPLKLQKQVDFLERNQDYVLCCHGYKILKTADDSIEKKLEAKQVGITFGNIENLHYWYTKTLTLFVRFDAFLSMPDSKQFRYWRDAHMCYYLLKGSKGFYMPFFGGVYREYNGGVYSSLSEAQKNDIFLRVYGEIYQYNKDDKEFATHFQNAVDETKKYAIWRLRLQDYSTEVKELIKTVRCFLWKDRQYGKLIAWERQLIRVAVKGSKLYQGLKHFIKRK